MLRLIKRGQSTAEYAILIGLIVAVAIGTQTYIKRGLQGRVKDGADDYVNSIDDDTTNWALISDNLDPVLETQWEDTRLASTTTQNITEDYEKSNMTEGGAVTRDSRRNTTQAADDYQKYDY